MRTQGACPNDSSQTCLRCCLPRSWHGGPDCEGVRCHRGAARSLLPAPMPPYFVRCRHAGCSSLCCRWCGCLRQHWGRIHFACSHRCAGRVCGGTPVACFAPLPPRALAGAPALTAPTVVPAMASRRSCEIGPALRLPTVSVAAAHAGVDPGLRGITLQTPPEPPTCMHERTLRVCFEPQHTCALARNAAA